MESNTAEAVDQEQEQIEQPQEAEQQPETTDDEIEISIGDEPPPQPAEDNSIIKEMRGHLKRIKAKNIELENRLKELAQPKVEVNDPGKKPTLEECDYDTDKFEAKYSQWQENKRKFEEKQQAAIQAQQEADQQWQIKFNHYNDQKKSLKVKDFEDAESSVINKFSIMQQNIIIQGADTPAHVVYALGTNDKIASELAAIKDPVKFAFAISKLETKMKIQPKRPANAPEKRVIGGGAGRTGALDNDLEKLRSEAERTGDYSKVHNYNRELKKRKSG